MPRYKRPEPLDQRTKLSGCIDGAELQDPTAKGWRFFRIEVISTDPRYRKGIPFRKNYSVEAPPGSSAFGLDALCKLPVDLGLIDEVESIWFDDGMDEPEEGDVDIAAFLIGEDVLFTLRPQRNNPDFMEVNGIFPPETSEDEEDF